MTAAPATTTEVAVLFSGTLDMMVSDVEAFINSPLVQKGVEQGIRNITGVPLEYFPDFHVSLRAKESSRLDGLRAPLRHLQAGEVTATYSGETAGAAATLTQNLASMSTAEVTQVIEAAVMKATGGSTFGLNVTSVAPQW
eukprot:CAMPEP_0168434050 /NCGR_PEP_ID=MMETSP0228-20121227/39710_1 /TAXON_ID=133427 /ORGANISM="Protoceratium reticulatum, Strain CCCM 535 (=CCMP 1889)" /LENGTH=139 /DNA_ID=CAMNT_0008448203 /DNA_START=19 /DNA_END=435 /DNA_ORIENTATION=+